MLVLGLIHDLCFEVDSNIVKMYKFDMLDRVSKFIPRELRLYMLMEEVPFWEHIEKKITTHIDPMLLITHNKKEAK